MSEWKKVRLGEVLSIKHGYAFPGEGIVSEDNGVVLVTPGNFLIGGGFKESGKKFFRGDYPSEYQFAGGELVVTMTDLSKTSDTLGVSAKIPYSKRCVYLHNQRIGLVTITDKSADEDFIYWFMRTDQYRKVIVAGASGTTVKHTSPSRIQDVELRLPPLPTQRKIAAVLSSLDDKIENNRKICANLEAQAQAIFKSWFVDFEPFGGKMPQGWKMGKLGDVGNIVGGATPSKAKAEFYTEEGIAWLTPKDLSLQQTKFVAKGEIDITEEGYKSASVRMLPKGSVLFSSRAPIGYVAIAKNELCTNQGFKSVVPFDWVGSEFVYQLLRMMTPVIEERASGSTFKEISSSGMKELPVIVPSKNVLHEFSSITLPMGESQKSLEDETRTLAATRDALLPKLMSGEIDVEKVKVA